VKTMWMTFLLFAVTAVAEILGCYLPYLWLKQGRTIWLLLPAAVSLAAFVWLLTLHPSAAGRTYAAYGGVYVCTGIAWLWLVERIRPDGWDLLGVSIILLGAGVMVAAPR
jgi:small multidrug resistance family-3 protein